MPARFGKRAVLVVKTPLFPYPAVPPRRIVRSTPHRCAGLPLGDEPGMHRRADEIEFHWHQRIEVVVERIAERRSEDHRPDWTRLVVIVHDLGIPGAE